MERKTERTAHLTFAVALAVLVVRSWGRLAEPGLWAEDGTLFLPVALKWDLLGIFEPTWGYFQVGPRMVAQLALLFPLRFFPVVSQVIWLATYAFVASLFARTSYRVFVPSDLARVFGALGLCFLPGLHEMAGTLCNLHWVLSLGGWLIAMKPAAEKVRPWEIGWVALAGLSGGETTVLLPIFAFRAWEGARYAGRSLWRNADGVAFAALVVATALNVSQRANQPPGLGPSLDQYLEGAKHLVMTFFVYVPWLGPSGGAWLSSVANRNFFPVWGSLALLVTGVVLVRRRQRSDLHLVLGVISWSFVVVLTWMARPGSIDWWMPQQLEATKLVNRYFFDLAPVALIFWLAVVQLEKAATQRVRAVLTGVLLVAAIPLSAIALGPIGPYEPRQAWQENAAMLDAALKSGKPQRVSFFISPQDWMVQVDVR